MANGAVFVPSDDWLSTVSGRMCKMCSLVITGSRDSGCSSCKASTKVPEKRAPSARGVPPLEQNHWVSFGLGTTSAAMNAGLPPLDHLNIPVEGKTDRHRAADSGALAVDVASSEFHLIDSSNVDAELSVVSCVGGNALDGSGCVCVCVCVVCVCVCVCVLWRAVCGVRVFV